MRRTDADTMFLGGGPRCAADRRALARLGQDKNYKLVLPTFDPADPAAGPIDFDVVVTDGIAETKMLGGGRLWKRDRSSAAVLLFADLGTVVALTTRGFMTIRGMKRSYREDGYALAHEAVSARASRKPGAAPVIASVGGSTMVLDSAAWFDWLKSME